MILIHPWDFARTRVGLVLVIILASAMASRAAPAQEAIAELPPGLSGWSPSLAVELGIHAQQLEAEGSASFGATDQGTNTVSNLIARLQAGVASPSIAWIPGRPRLTLNGGMSFPLRETVTITSSQTLGDEAEFGTDLSVAWKAMWHGAVALRFRLPIDGLGIYVQPGAEYLGSRLRYESLFTFRPEPGSPGAQQGPNPRNPPTFPFAGRSSPVIHHFVGPTLAIRTDFARIGPFSISAYLQGRAYFLVGDRDTETRFSGLVLGAAETAEGRLESNLLAGQVGFGIRGSF